MPFKPNYNLARSERNRAKAMKQQEKQQRRESEAAKRRALREGEAAGEPRSPDVDAADAADTSES